MYRRSLASAIPGEPELRRATSASARVGLRASWAAHARPPLPHPAERVGAIRKESCSLRNGGGPASGARNPLPSDPSIRPVRVPTL